MANLTALVPLDTTAFSETSLLVLPMLKSIGFDKVRLVSVADPKKAAAGSLETYLQTQSAKVTAAGLEAETRVLTGEPAAAIITAAAESDVDLILVATHGRTGIARLRLGSVGEKLIKEASCPRLVVGPNVDIDLTTYALKRILLPLDGNEMAETSLPVAKYLAGLTGASIDLIRSVSATTIASDPSMAGVDLLTPMMDEASSYLGRIAETLPGLAVNSTVVIGRPDESILDHLKKNPVDLVIMVSRGRTGLARLALGSVTERVLQGPDPVLLYEPGEDRSRLFQAARGS